MGLDSGSTSKKGLAFALSTFALAAAITGCGAALTGGRSTPVSISLSVTPASASVGISQSQQFSVSVQNDAQSKGVNWFLMQSGVACTAECGTLSSAGTYQVTYSAPAKVPNPPTVTLIATSVADTARSASATVTVSTAPPVPISVSIFPTSLSLEVSQTQAFTATVQNDNQNRGVIWNLTQSGNVCSPACGTLSEPNPVNYTAPSTVPNPATVILTATSVSDSTKSASAPITIIAQSPPIAVSVSPRSASLQTSESMQFIATVQNDIQNSGVTWTLLQSNKTCSPACGSLPASTSESALYVAPATAPNPAVVTLTATSVADNTKTAAAMIFIGNVSSSGGLPNVGDITSYGARAVTSLLSTPASCVSGSNILNVGSAADFAPGDGISVYNCGPTIAVVTPTAPSASSGASATATMLDTPIVPYMGAGQTFKYRLVTRDNKGGLTLPSPISTMTNGNSLGQQKIAVTTATTLGQQMTINLASNGPPNGTKVHLRGTSNSTFDVFGQISSGGGTSSIVLANLPFASQVTVTGGNLYYFNANQLTWTNQSGAVEQIICASRPADLGAYHVIGIAPPNFAIFNDWGATITTPPNPLPPYLNDGVCTATGPTNDYLSDVTITGINGNLVTMSANAGQTTPNGTMNIDVAPALLAAQSTLRAANGGSNTALYIPCVTMSNAVGAFFLTSSIDLSLVSLFNGIEHCGTIIAYETITMEGVWTGTTSDAGLGNSIGPAMVAAGAYPVFYGPNGLNVNNVAFTGNSNCLFIQDGYPNNGGGNTSDMNDLGFACGGYAPITILELNGFQHFFKNLFPNVGPGNAPSFMDTTWAASFYVEGAGNISISNQNQGFGGEFFDYNPTGIAATLQFDSFYVQGSIMPSISTYCTASSEYITSVAQVNDTSPMPYIELDPGPSGGLYYVWLENPYGNVPDPISGVSPVAFYPVAVPLPGYTFPSDYLPDATGNAKFELNSVQVSDNFNRANAPIGQNWTVYQGGFNVVDDVAVGTGGVNNQALYTGSNGQPLPITAGGLTSYGQGQWASTLITNASSVAGVIVSGGNGNGSGGGGINVPGALIGGYGCFEYEATLVIYWLPTAGPYAATAKPAETAGDIVFCSVVPSPSGNIVTAVAYSAGGTVTTLTYTDVLQTKVWGLPGIWTQGMTASVDNFTAGTIPAVASSLNENYWMEPQHFVSFIQLGSITFAALPPPGGTVHDGTLIYCKDCVYANPCAGSGAGAIAKLLNGTWVCN